ncbi:hypothetical protein WA026_004281 [Henosepilachna vigintioctopunctata]|uniref:Uncharacterized protein n=1 Tax=Henosepilachna vigintioctopunctata TaxID=420089 RepID=A0AAW1V8D2_9CUCU
MSSVTAITPSPVSPAAENPRLGDDAGDGEVRIADEEATPERSLPRQSTHSHLPPGIFVIVEIMFFVTSEHLPFA